MKRKILKLFLGMVMIMAMASACGKEKMVVPSLLNPFIGEWQCEETPLEHEDYYTGYLALRIQEDASFSMYDAEAGNPGISGELDIMSDTELVLNCNTEDDFDPPPTWENMSEKQTITYKFVSEYELHMLFENDGNISTLVFRMGGAEVNVDTFVFMEDKVPEGDTGNLFYVQNAVVESMCSPELYLLNNGLLFTEMIIDGEISERVLKLISLEDGSLVAENCLVANDDAVIQFGEECIVLYDPVMESIQVMDGNLQLTDSLGSEYMHDEWYLGQEWSDGCSWEYVDANFPELRQSGSKLLHINEAGNSFGLYKLNGEHISHCALSEDTTHHVSSNFVWSGYRQGYYFVDTTEAGSRLMFWDPEIPIEGEDFPINLEEAEDEPAFTMSELKEKASELSEQYDVDIRVGDDCDLNYVGYSAVVFEEKQAIADSLNVLDTCLSNYPEGFMEQLLFGTIESIRIELVTDLRVNEGIDAVDASGFVEERQDYIVAVLDANFLLEDTVYHELTHVIDKRLKWDMNTKKDTLFSEKEWLRLQPEGFDYAYSYTNIPESVEEYYGSGYFVSDYACTFPTEDRATMLEKAMMGYEEEFAGKPELRAKLEYYSECMRDCFETKTWPETTQWEKIIK